MRALAATERDELIAALDLALNSWEDSVLEPLFDELIQHRYDDTETIIAHWHRKHGDCYDCNLPAAYRNEVGQTLCCVCAADQASHGGTITRLDEEPAS